MSSTRTRFSFLSFARFVFVVWLKAVLSVVLLTYFYLMHNRVEQMEASTALIRCASRLGQGEVHIDKDTDLNCPSCQHEEEEEKDPVECETGEEREEEEEEEEDQSSQLATKWLDSDSDDESESDLEGEEDAMLDAMDSQPESMRTIRIKRSIDTAFAGHMDMDMDMDMDFVESPLSYNHKRAGMIESPSGSPSLRLDSHELLDQDGRVSPCFRQWIKRSVPNLSTRVDCDAAQVSTAKCVTYTKPPARPSLISIQRDEGRRESARIRLSRPRGIRISSGPEPVEASPSSTDEEQFIPLITTEQLEQVIETSTMLSVPSMIPLPPSPQSESPLSRSASFSGRQSPAPSQAESTLSSTLRFFSSRPSSLLSPSVEGSDKDKGKSSLQRRILHLQPRKANSQSSSGRPVMRSLLPRYFSTPVFSNRSGASSGSGSGSPGSLRSMRSTSSLHFHLSARIAKSDGKEKETPASRLQSTSDTRAETASEGDDTSSESTSKEHSFRGDNKLMPPTAKWLVDSVFRRSNKGQRSREVYSYPYTCT